MNKNKTIGIVVFIIISIAIVIYFFTRAKKAISSLGPGTGADEPIISISSADLIKKSETENYMTEYYTLAELSEKVKIKTTLNIQNVYLVKELKIERINGSNTNIIQKKDIVITQTGTPGQDYSVEVEFEPEEGENMAVKHTIIVYYKTFISDNDEFIQGPDASVTISESDLSLVSLGENNESVSLQVVIDNKFINSINITINYATVKLNETDIFSGQKIYFSPVENTNSKGFKILGLSDTQKGQLGNDTTFYILKAGDLFTIATTETEETTTKYITYNDNILSLSDKNINFRSKLFTIVFKEELLVCPNTSGEDNWPDWGPCNSIGKQYTRRPVNSGCQEGTDSAIAEKSQNCCTQTNWITPNTSTCSSITGQIQQTRNVTAGCLGDDAKTSQYVNCCYQSQNDNDFYYTDNDWGPCNSDGQKTKTRDTKNCSGISATTSRTVDCKKDCAGGWVSNNSVSGWSAASCGQTRYKYNVDVYQITQDAKNNGNACKDTDGTVRTNGQTRNGTENQREIYWDSTCLSSSFHEPTRVPFEGSAYAYSPWIDKEDCAKKCLANDKCKGFENYKNECYLYASAWAGNTYDDEDEGEVWAASCPESDTYRLKGQTDERNNLDC